MKTLSMKLFLFLVEACNKANIFLGPIEYELNSASHFVDYIYSIYIYSYSIRPRKILANYLKRFS